MFSHIVLPPLPAMDRQSLVSQGRLIIETASRLSSDTSHSVGILSKSDQPGAEISIWKHTTFRERDIYLPSEIRTYNPNMRVAVEPRLTPRGHWGVYNCFIILSEITDYFSAEH